MIMKTSIVLLLLLMILSSPSNNSLAKLYSLTKGSSLSVEKPNEDVLVSSNGVFSAGFRSVGDNAYYFAIWFTQSSNSTIVWMANRDQPVNGKRSVLLLSNNGNLVLKDIGRIDTWSTNTDSISPVQLRLLDNGNLILLQTLDNIIWESFKFPTDTLLPLQPLTRYTKLVSSRSESNYSLGRYSFYFDNDNMLHLLYDGPETSSAYWPDPWDCWPPGRWKYNSSRVALFNSSGHFQSSDKFKFSASDLGVGPLRRLTMDFDGNLRLYSLDENKGSWFVSWQAISQPCSIHGICGPDSLCVHDERPRRCSCLPGFKYVNDRDWSAGCEPKFNISVNTSDQNLISFVELPNVDIYGFDLAAPLPRSLEDCKTRCLQLGTCKAVMYRKGTCYLKSLLFNGVRSPNFEGTTYVILPKQSLNINESAEEKSSPIQILNCSSTDDDDHVIRQLLKRDYPQSHENRFLVYLLWFVGAMGGIEMICIFIGFFCLYRVHGNTRRVHEGYGLFVLAGFRKFTYKELEKATMGFNKEIGRGGAGTVYKGMLSDGRVAAIKRLHHEAKREDHGEFLAEVGTIGRINHMNLIEMYGFCAEGKNRLLVYEYMECGSLAENLASNVLDWETRFEIALGTAKGLAYLHEECLEWVLHCDVKPENILLDSSFRPKVADFGLSKLLDRGRISNSSFSTVRGTRGYMAPEWVFNLPITSKVDVYSYGIVVLELITGKSPTVLFHAVNDSGETEYHRLVKWVREKMMMSASMDDVALAIEEIRDPRVENEYCVAKMEVLIRVALQCVEEERDARPTMSKVVEMLIHHENT